MREEGRTPPYPGVRGQAAPEGRAQRLIRQAAVYDARMRAFEVVVTENVRSVRKRRSKRDYATKNCEEAYGGRNRSGKATDSVG